MATFLAILQARMSSSRLPGKVLLPVCGRPMLSRQFERLRRSREIQHFMLATSTLAADGALEEFARGEGIDCYRGSQDDVLERFYGAASRYLEETGLPPQELFLVRLTGDCPLADPLLVDAGIRSFEAARAQGLRYQGYDKSMPDGFDFEIFSFEALEQAQREAKEPFEREHVTPYLWGNPGLFPAQYFSSPGLDPKIRLSVDYPVDLQVVESVFRREEHLGRMLSAAEIHSYLKESGLWNANQGIVNNEGLILSSLASERFSTEIHGRKVPRIGLCTEGAPALLLEWAFRMGIRIFVGPESALSLPAGALQLTEPPAQWKKLQAAEILSAPSVPSLQPGIILHSSMISETGEAMLRLIRAGSP